MVSFDLSHWVIIIRHFIIASLLLCLFDLFRWVKMSNWLRFRVHVGFWERENRILGIISIHYQILIWHLKRPEGWSKTSVKNLLGIKSTDLGFRLLQVQPRFHLGWMRVWVASYPRAWIHRVVDGRSSSVRRVVRGSLNRWSLLVPACDLTWLEGAEETPRPPFFVFLGLVVILEGRVVLSDLHI